MGSSKIVRHLLLATSLISGGAVTACADGSGGAGVGGAAESSRQTSVTVGSGGDTSDSTTDASTGSSTSQAATTSTGAPGCKGIFTGACGACLESHCCSELALCAGSQNCLDCVTGAPQGTNCSANQAANGLLDCGNSYCYTQCAAPSTTTSTSTTTTGGGPVSCTSGNFTISLTQPMPSSYLAAGYGAQDQTLLFYGTGTPAHVYEYNIAAFLSGNLTVANDDHLYDQGPALSLTRPASLHYAWVLSKFPSGSAYGVYAGSDANLQLETWNLPTLGQTDSLTSVVTPTPYALARVGSEVYERDASTTTWSFVAPLASAGTTSWRGLAVVRSAAGERDFFTQATISGGASGIVEQRWPTSSPSVASTPVVVFSETDLVPVGASSDGCELYTSRTSANGFELVVLHR